MIKWFIFALCLMTSCSYAKLSSHVDSTRISLGQTFHLEIAQENVPGTSLPDLSPLEADFVTIGTQRSTSYSMMNGQTSSMNQWIIELMPKKTGLLTIPAIKVGNEHTDVSLIEVVADKSSSKTVSDKNLQDIILVAEANKRQPYVNQQVLYTVKLYNSRQLLNASYTPPYVEDALLFPLGNGRHYQSMENGRAYMVDEQQYAIFPQKSGKLSITPPTLSALIYQANPQPVKIKAADLTLDVKPIPSNFKSDWLPAKAVQLKQNYASQETAFNQGSTLIRNLELSVVGAPAQLLPKLSFENTPNFNVYAEKPAENNTLESNEIVGTRTFKVTYLLNHAGDIQLPDIKLAWFNTVTGKAETTTLPGKMIHVKPVVNQNQPSVSQQPLIQPRKPNRTSSALPWWIAGGFAFAWLVTLALSKRNKRPKTKKIASLSALKNACLTNDLSATRTALLYWAKEQWPDRSLLTLAEIKQLNLSAEINNQIDELIQASYSSEAIQWQGDALWAAIEIYKKPRQQKITQDETLPPLNP